MVVSGVGKGTCIEGVACEGEVAGTGVEEWSMCLFLVWEEELESASFVES